VRATHGSPPKNRGVYSRLPLLHRGCGTGRVSAGTEHDVEIRNVHDPAVAVAASGYGIRRLPAVVIDGRLADCYAGRGLDEATLTQAIFGWIPPYEPASLELEKARSAGHSDMSLNRQWPSPDAYSKANLTAFAIGTFCGVILQNLELSDSGL
jgi:hypothetical protein